MLRPAVFIDRDGTLTEEVGYVNHPRRLRLLPRSADAFQRFIARTDTIKPGALMPAFGMLPPGDLRALAAYLDALK